MVICAPGRLQVNIDKLTNWLRELLETKGANIFRSKGLLAARGCNEKHVFQGVHVSSPTHLFNIKYADEIECCKTAKNKLDS